MGNGSSLCWCCARSPEHSSQGYGGKRGFNDLDREETPGGELPPLPSHYSTHRMNPSDVRDSAAHSGFHDSSLASPAADGTQGREAAGDGCDAHDSNRRDQWPLPQGTTSPAAAAAERLFALQGGGDGAAAKRRGGPPSAHVEDHSARTAAAAASATGAPAFPSRQSIPLSPLEAASGHSGAGDGDSPARAKTPVFSEKLIFASTTQMRNVQTVIGLHTMAHRGHDANNNGNIEPAEEGGAAESKRRKKKSFRWRLLYTSNVHGLSAAKMRERVRRVLHAHGLDFPSPPSSVFATSACADEEGKRTASSILSSPSCEVPTLLLVETSSVVYGRARSSSSPALAANNATTDSKRGKSDAREDWVMDAEEAAADASLRPFHVCIGVYLHSLPASHVKQYYTSRDAFLFSFCVPVRPPPQPPQQEGHDGGTGSSWLAPAHADGGLVRDDSASVSPPLLSKTQTKRAAAFATSSNDTICARSPTMHSVPAFAAPHSGDKEVRTGALFPDAEDDDAEADMQTEERCSTGGRQQQRHGGGLAGRARRGNVSPNIPLALRERSNPRASAGASTNAKGDDGHGRSEAANGENDNDDNSNGNVSGVPNSSITSVSETTAATHQTGLSSMLPVLLGPSRSVSAYGPSVSVSLRDQPHLAHFWHRQGSNSGAASAFSGTLVSVSSTDNDDENEEGSAKLSDWAASSSTPSAASPSSSSSSSTTTTTTTSTSSLPSTSSLADSSAARHPLSTSRKRKVIDKTTTKKKKRSFLTGRFGRGRHDEKDDRSSVRGGAGSVRGGDDNSSSLRNGCGCRYHRQPVLVLDEKDMQRINPLFTKPTKRERRRRSKNLCILVTEEGTTLIWIGDINKQPALILTNDLAKIVCHAQLPLVGPKRTVRKFIEYVHKAEQFHEGHSSHQEENSSVFYDDEAATGHATLAFSDRDSHRSHRGLRDTGNAEEAAPAIHPARGTPAPTAMASAVASGGAADGPSPNDACDDANVAAANAVYADPHNAPGSDAACREEVVSGASGEPAMRFVSSAASSPPALLHSGDAAGSTTPLLARCSSSTVTPTTAPTKDEPLPNGSLRGKNQSERVSINGSLGGSERMAASAKPGSRSSQTSASRTKPTKKMKDSQRDSASARQRRSRKFDLSTDVVKVQLCSTSALL